jgi:TRAP-type mannitol/chloroaromatic compound transport system permease small subunit
MGARFFAKAPDPGENGTHRAHTKTATIAGHTAHEAKMPRPRKGIPMTQLLALSRLIDRMNEHLGKVASLLVLVACLISAGNAGMRYAFGLSSNAWLEIQWYMFAAMFMLGAAYTLKRNEHVRVDIVFSHLSTRQQIWVDIFGGLLFLLPATLILTWLSWPVLVDAWHSQETSGNAGGLVRWPVKLFLPLGFALLTLQGVSEIIKRIAMLTGHMQPDLHYERPLQ